jgi:DNA-binding CsgD family transcriptional regulator
MAAKPPDPNHRTQPPRLSPREAEVAAWLGEDDTYAQIAARLGLKHDTVRGHARAIFAKLGVRTRPAAVARLLGQGIGATQKGRIDCQC